MAWEVSTVKTWKHLRRVSAVVKSGTNFAVAARSESPFNLKIERRHTDEPEDSGRLLTFYRRKAPATLTHTWQFGR